MYILRKDLKKALAGSVKTLDLANLQTHIHERMSHLENIVGHMENIMGHMKDAIVEIIVKILQNSKEKFINGDDVGQGTQEYKYSVPVDPPSINKHSRKGFYFNT